MIKRIGLDRFSCICSNGMPEYAGQKIPYAVLVFEHEEGKLGELHHSEGGYLVFDEQGNVDERNRWNHLRLAQAGERDPKSFAARRAAQVRKENTWHPSGAQLQQMIALVKRKS
jgi:hypothetical protein